MEKTATKTTTAETFTCDHPEHKGQKYKTKASLASHNFYFARKAEMEAWSKWYRKSLVLDESADKLVADAQQKNEALREALQDDAVSDAIDMLVDTSAVDNAYQLGTFATPTAATTEQTCAKYTFELAVYRVDATTGSNEKLVFNITDGMEHFDRAAVFAKRWTEGG